MRSCTGAAHIFVVRKGKAGFELDDFAAIGGASEVLVAQQIQLLLNAHISNHIHLLTVPPKAPAQTMMEQRMA